MPLATVINTNFKQVLKQKNKGAGENLTHSHITILDAPTILIETIEILDFWGYWRFSQQIFQKLPTILDAPTILIVTIEILDFWGYWRFSQQIFQKLPTILDAPTILIVTIEILDFWDYWRFFKQIFYKQNNVVRAKLITSLHYNIYTTAIVPHYYPLTTTIYFIK